MGPPSPRRPGVRRLGGSLAYNWRVHHAQPTGELAIEVKDGVTAGEQIVTGPFKSLRTIKDGDEVMIEKEKKGAGPGGENASH